MSHHDLKEIYWRSRRGMLELELKLVPFVRDCFSNLDVELQKTYVELLAEEDWQIYDWLQDKETPDKSVMIELVLRIKNHVGKI